MIYARMEKLKDYMDPDSYIKIKAFLDSISKDSEEGRYEISGDDIFARVQSYDTIPIDEARVEAHDRYIDIQFTLVGAEGISVFDRSDLEAADEYNEEKDVCHYEPDETKVIAHTDNIPGYFTLLYPEDAHRPKERIRGIDRVKKAVIKMRVR